MSASLLRSLFHLSHHLLLAASKIVSTYCDSRMMLHSCCLFKMAANCIYAAVCNQRQISDVVIAVIVGVMEDVHDFHSLNHLPCCLSMMVSYSAIDDAVQVNKLFTMYILLQWPCYCFLTYTKKKLVYCFQ